MANDKRVEVQMTMDTYNTDMGGRLREGHVYEMSAEYADHLMAVGLARTPTKRGRELTEQTQEEEIAELEERLARLRGDAPGGAGSMIMGAPNREPAPVPHEGSPLVSRPVTGQRTARSQEDEKPPEETPEGGSIGTPATESMDLTGQRHPAPAAPRRQEKD